MKSVIIIGAGITGLSAGVYGRMNGYKTNIFEMHNLPGGLCTSWKRKGYTFDFCIDWMGGVNPEAEDSNLWKELGVLKGKKLAFFNEMLRIRQRDGRDFIYYADPQKLQEQMFQLTYYDDDKKKVRDLCSSIDTFIKAPSFKFDKPDILYNWVDLIKTAIKYKSTFKVLVKYNTTLIQNFFRSILDPRLREFLSFIYFTPDIPFCLVPPMYTMTNLFKKNMGYPQGGSMGLARSLESRYKELGGEIHYNAKAEKIIIKNGKAAGIMLENGTEHFADYIITACDSHTVYYGLLEGKYENQWIKKLFKEGAVFPSILKVFMGVNRSFKDQPDSIIFKLGNSLNIPGIIHEKTNTLLVRHFCNMDPDYAPPGKSVLVCFWLADYDAWSHIYSKGKDFYKKTKDELANTIIRQLEEFYPGIKDEVEVYDVCTPLTIERYTGNYKGSIQGFIEDLTELKSWLIKSGGMKIKGVDNILMVGQWITLQGLLRTAGGGRFAIRTLCKKDKKKFIVKSN